MRLHIKAQRGNSSHSVDKLSAASSAGTAGCFCLSDCLTEQQVVAGFVTVRPIATGSDELKESYVPVTFPWPVLK